MKTNKHPIRIILLGPPGSGKGTQGEMLAHTLKLPRLSVGALLRKQYTRKTPPGIKAHEYTDKGLAVPGELLIPMLDAWFSRHPEGFVVDNLIRSEDQLDAFSNYQKEKDFSLSAVIRLVITEESARKRLEKRRKGRAVRHDETPHAINERFRVYVTGIEPIIAYFKSLGVYTEVNGEGTVDEVATRILNRVKKVVTI